MYLVYFNAVKYRSLNIIISQLFFFVSLSPALGKCESSLSRVKFCLSAHLVVLDLSTPATNWLVLNG